MTSAGAPGRAPAVRVGPAGWSYADWEGIVYPRPRPRGFHPLPLLARSFDCVEVNSSFYALPDPAHVAAWVEHVADRPRFRFLAKLHGGFTHEPWDPAGAGPRMEAFLAALAPLAEAGRLGGWLAQFPAGFRNDEPGRRRLADLAELLGEGPRAVEVRHRSWFTPAALRLLGDQGWSVAHIDLPSSPQHPPEWHEPTGALGYLRLHGRNAATWFTRGVGRDDRYDYLYSEPEVAGVVEKARRLAGACDETYVVTNNHFGGQAVANAIEIAVGLTGEPVPAPAELLAAFPRLAPRVRVEGQGRLF